MKTLKNILSFLPANSNIPQAVNPSQTAQQFWTMLPYHQAINHYSNTKCLDKRNLLVIQIKTKDALVFNDLQFLYHQVEYGLKTTQPPELHEPLAAVGYADFSDSNFGRNSVHTNSVPDHGNLLLLTRSKGEADEIIAQHRHLSTLFQHVSIHHATQIEPNFPQLMRYLIHMFERDSWGAASWRNEPVVFPASKRICDQSLVASHSNRTNKILNKICPKSLKDLQADDFINYPRLPDWLDLDDYEDQK